MTGKPSGSRSVGRSSNPERLVLLDANTFFLPLTDGFPLEEELRRCAAPARPAVWTGTIAELQRLVGRSVPRANAALALASRFRRVVARGRGDQGLLDLAVRRGAWVVTSDRALRDRLLRAGVTVLFPRERSRLALRRGRTGGARPRAASRPATVKNGPPVRRAVRRRRGDAAR